MPNHRSKRWRSCPSSASSNCCRRCKTNDGSVPTHAVMAELQARKQRAAGMARAGAKMPTSLGARGDGLRRSAESLGMPPQMQAGTQQYAEGGKIEDEMRAWVRPDVAEDRRLLPQPGVPIGRCWRA